MSRFHELLGGFHYDSVLGDIDSPLCLYVCMCMCACIPVGLGVCAGGRKGKTGKV